MPPNRPESDSAQAIRHLAQQLERTNRLLEALAPRFWSLEQVVNRNPGVSREILVALLRERGVYEGKRGKRAAIPVEAVLELERELVAGGGDD